MAAGIQIDRVHYRYPGGDWALKGLELILEPGEYTVMFGANGSGKSTAAYLMNGLIPHFFVSVISPEDLGAALRQLRLPHGLVFMFTAGLRYVPLMENKIRSIRDAQQARGIDLRFRLKNVRNWMAFLAPLLVQSFLLADELAIAMESRGFSRPHRTCRRQARLTWRDGLVMAAALGLLLALAWWEKG